MLYKDCAEIIWNIKLLKHNVLSVKSKMPRAGFVVIWQQNCGGIY